MHISEVHYVSLHVVPLYLFDSSMVIIIYTWNTVKTIVSTTTKNAPLFISCFWYYTFGCDCWTKIMHLLWNKQPLNQCATVFFTNSLCLSFCFHSVMHTQYTLSIWLIISRSHVKIVRSARIVKPGEVLKQCFNFLEKKINHLFRAAYILWARPNQRTNERMHEQQCARAGVLETLSSNPHTEPPYSTV